MSMTTLITFEFRTMNVFNVRRFEKECFLRMIFCASTFECHTSKVEIIKTFKDEGSTTLSDKLFILLSSMGDVSTI